MAQTDAPSVTPPPGAGRTATPPPGAGPTAAAPTGADTLPASAARLRVALVRLTRALRQRGNVGNNLTATLLGALGTVETRGPVTLGELAAAEDVQPPTMTRVVAKLEERGLVQREADPADRRVARVRVTEAGRALMAESRTRRDAFLAQRLATLSPAEVAAIEAALPVLERLACMPVNPGRSGVTAFSEAFRSLRTRNYRLYFIGQLVSLSGTWMQTAALAWLVLNLRGDNSGGALGLVIAAQFLPTLLFGAWGGVIADRFDKRHVLLLTQSSMAVVAAVLAVTSLTGVIEMWMVFALSAAMGLGTAVDNPVRQAFVTEMVGREDLPNAVGLSSATFNSARIVGPALGAAVLAVFGDNVSVGTGVCFAVNAVSFLAVLTCLALMRPAELNRAVPQPRAKGQVRAGFQYAMGEPHLRTVLTMMALIGLFGMNFQVVLPLVAKNTFDGGAGVFGALQVAMGIGSLVGSLAAATRKAPPTLPFLGTAAAVFGVTMLGVAVSPTVAVALVLLFLTGIASMTLFAAANTTLQLTARADMRGRVMALYILLIMGSTPVGGPLIGWLGQHAGARWAVAAGGFAGLGGALVVVSDRMGSRRAALAGAAEAASVGVPVGH